MIDMIDMIGSIVGGMVVGEGEYDIILLIMVGMVVFVIFLMRYGEVEYNEEEDNLIDHYEEEEDDFTE